MTTMTTETRVFPSTANNLTTVHVLWGARYAQA
jgi:hypothetical protein